MTEPPKKSTWWTRLPAWQRKAVEALIYCSGAGYLYWYFADFEQSRETSRSMNWLFATFYNLGGKWLPVGAVLLVAAHSGYEAIRAYRTLQAPPPGQEDGFDYNVNRPNRGPDQG